jgi:TIR domain
MESKVPSHIFISYSRKNSILAEGIQVDLERVGFPVFRDNAIRPGEYWDLALEKALRQSFAVVTLWTPDSINSKWVRIESRFAESCGMLCPVLFTQCDIPLEFSSTQCADFRYRSVHDSTHPEWIKLVAQLRSLSQDRHTINFNTEMHYRIGLKFLYGINCPSDISIAQYWLTTAAQAGHLEASRILAKHNNLL